MPTIHLHATTSATPDQFLAALVDFGPHRSQLFPNSADDDLQVHELGTDHADVTEGSGGIWERLRYDWSDPRRIVMTTTDSNLWGPGSGHTYTLTERTDGRTAVDAVVVRTGKNLKGRVTGLLLATVGKGVLSKALATTVHAVEARHSGAPAGSPARRAAAADDASAGSRAPYPRVAVTAAMIVSATISGRETLMACEAPSTSRAAFAPARSAMKTCRAAGTLRSRSP